MLLQSKKYELPETDQTVGFTPAGIYPSSPGASSWVIRQFGSVVIPRIQRELKNSIFCRLSKGKEKNSTPDVPHNVSGMCS